MTVTLSLTEIISFLGLMVSLLGVFGTIIWHLWKRVLENASKLAEFKLQVAEQYASYTHIAELDKKMIRTEQNLITSINNLTSRIDRILSRFEERR